MPHRKTALITGSAKKRVGYYIAEAFAKAGYRIIIHYRTSKADAQLAIVEMRELGADAIAIGADLTNQSEVARLVEESIRYMGRIDVLVNAAAVWMPKPFEEIEAIDLTAHFDTNTLGTFLISREVGLRMCQMASGGCIVNIGDWADVRPYMNYAAYFPSKAAIPGLTRTLAVELGARNPNVRVNAVLPGPVMLPDDMSEADRNQAIEGTIVKREGKPHNVAQAVMALVENDFITGVCLPVDGGRSIYACGM
ncbi:MAG: SDR family oxidoreductase [Fimbriiglobus sp.]